MVTAPSHGKWSGIASRIRRRIAASELRSRDRLPAERHLAREFGVARGTVRRALEELVGQGAIRAVRGSGHYVSDEGERNALPELFRTAKPLELMDVRFALEPHICRLAVLNATSMHFDRFEELLLEMEAHATDAPTFAEADARFHDLLVESTGNPLFAWLSARIGTVRAQRQWTVMRHLTLEPNIIARYNAQHREIAEAIMARDADRAAGGMKAHLETARSSLTRALAT